MSTFHSHSFFCDGYGHPEEYVKSAITKGFKAIGISSHAPVTFYTDWTMPPERLNEYISVVNGLKKQYSDQIQVYLGLETDFYDTCIDYRDISDLDYTIGSVHFLFSEITGRYMPMDGSIAELEETLHVVYKNDIRALVSDYYSAVREMLRKIPPDIIGHLDVLKKNNSDSQYFNESEGWYRDAVMQTLDTAKKAGCVVEVNTGGISRGYTKEMYPSDWILKEILNMGIPIMLNSDTHHPDTIDCYYPDAIKRLNIIGFKSQRILLNNKWTDIELSECCCTVSD